LEAIGHRLQETVDPDTNTARRFVRGTSTVELVAAAALLACGEDPFAEREGLAGPGRQRLLDL
jgi:hypothetical protein